MGDQEGDALTNQNFPALSVVIVADRYETIRKTMQHLRAQGVRDRLEILIVTLSSETLGLDGKEAADFLAVRIVEVPAILPLSVALAAGVRQSSAPVIVLAESHSYPGAGWARALIEAHKKPWVAVGPVIGNANPDSIISWANLFLDYGRCVETTQVGEVDYLPGHNTSYKREAILQYDSELEAMMDSEILLQWDMRSKGYALFLEQAAKTYHLNISLLSSWLSERFYTGRRFAATRARNWSAVRRLVYTGGAPLIPVVRFRRVLQDIRCSTRRHELLPRIVPALMVGLAASALGEMIGYAFGAGEAVEKLAKMELHKVHHVTEWDRRTLDALLPRAAE